MRVYLVYAFLILFGVSIVGRILFLQLFQGEYWQQKAEDLTIAYHEIEAVRGNIFTDDGSLLATSLPIYEVRMDLAADAITQEIFNNNIDSLSICLSKLFGDRSWQQYRNDFKEARRKKNRYYLVRRNVSYSEVNKLKEFPLYRHGRYKGGLILVQKNKRTKPFKFLAARTIGYEIDGVTPVGIEGAYNTELKGTGGKRLMQKISGGIWKPLNDENEIEPKDGNDVTTTIDINIQDVAESALLTQLQKHNAVSGCVVVMEVATGEIKAIANLSKKPDAYGEHYNWAIGESSEPGSTFKLASMIAAIEDGLIDINDSIDTENGTKRYYDAVMKDSKEGGYGKITVQRAFELSSNVAMSKLISQSYSKNPQKFIDHLKFMGLDKEVGVEIKGEGKPVIKNTDDKSWSAISLPWMSIGYETRLTPLQILCLYNAVANDGYRVKPMMIKSISHRGKILETFEPQVESKPICSEKTLLKVRAMLEGVVEHGTASNLKNSHFKIAGKTGTAQIANSRHGYNKVSYQASFVGYFPAEKPLYSCIVMVYSPSNSVYYGNVVAGPIFKEIADKVYATRIDLHTQMASAPAKVKIPTPQPKAGNLEDLKVIYSKLETAPHIERPEAVWVGNYKDEKGVHLVERTMNSGVVPNVSGMGMRDAIYLLENAGLRVRAVGRGTVYRQSVNPGSRIRKGENITIELS